MNNQIKCLLAIAVATSAVGFAQAKPVTQSAAPMASGPGLTNGETGTASDPRSDSAGAMKSAKHTKSSHAKMSRGASKAPSAPAADGSMSNKPVGTGG